MKTMVSREVRIKDAFKPFLDTVTVYQEAVSFLIDVVNEHYVNVCGLPSQKAMTFIERLVHSTSTRKALYPSFDIRFHKLPSYLRRAAIMESVAAVTLYRKNLAEWEVSDKLRKKPFLKRNRNVMPAFYRDNMFILNKKDGVYMAKLKLFRDGDWKWHVFNLSQADVRSIKKEFDLADAKCPVLKRHGQRFSLSFAFETNAELPKKDKKEYSICAVDIGINNAAVCSIMKEDGTVTARRFITFTGEEDRFNRDRFLKNHNENLARLTSSAIVEFASSEGASVIVMENLSIKGKVKCSKKERLHLWRKKDVSKRVEALAHRREMRFSTVWAAGTSKYAFDGSGRVKRDKDNFSQCTFSNGKRYNTDLSASYNIGARFFIRETLKACPETEASEAKAKVPGLSVRATCTLSTYISLLAARASA